MGGCILEGISININLKNVVLTHERKPDWKAESNWWKLRVQWENLRILLETSCHNWKLDIRKGILPTRCSRALRPTMNGEQKDW